MSTNKVLKIRPYLIGRTIINLRELVAVREAGRVGLRVNLDFTFKSGNTVSATMEFKEVCSTEQLEAAIDKELLKIYKAWQTV